jgi:hypothetical protein
VELPVIDPDEELRRIAQALSALSDWDADEAADKLRRVATALRAKQALVFVRPETLERMRQAGLASEARRMV